ncbi:MAG: diphosphate--fructose-6-phosphate 1-phosphotransferase [Armatimonadota bacterium]|nr:diphosphate--fructose-6-phosphate 1-phosphotransferase [Armatimonadota bacterium]MCX7777459.1 diphosphate--fructose-6-phosphate 1-phosphotransferase [Armatimonadota bacterium]MDW8025533.1 diphosphate--fructose-6-phosphate 1-phosphotransferase [Armatimonadota bacterium]
MAEVKQQVGILVGGGPAPGINGVIEAATIRARNLGWNVIGIYDGFEHLMRGDTTKVKPLSIEDVSQIHFLGGSILRTSRANPLKRPDGVPNTLNALRELGITCLVTIGGDDTATVAHRIARESGGQLRVAHVPKTIDNDLPLPDNTPTFGFTTACEVGASLVRNVIDDARTAVRWYFIVAMGRAAGHLALGIGSAAGATVTVIPEEFPKDKIKLDEVCDVIEGAILKSKVLGREDGVAVIAEGIGEKLDPEELEAMPGVVIERDEHGHLRLAEVPLGDVIKRRIQQRFKERGDKITIVDLTLGYELRCAPPNVFDMIYTRQLGHGAIEFLREEPTDPKLRDGGMVCIIRGERKVLAFDEFIDPQTGRARTRKVDLNSDLYRCAYDYMIRLKREDFEDEEMLNKLASKAKMTPEEFRARYGYIVGL